MNEKHFASKDATFVKYAKSHHIFQDQYVLSLQPLESDFKPTKKINLQGPKGTTIYVYSLDLQLLNTFTSSRIAAKYFICSERTIIKYA
jgi:hypothetical protein